MTVSVLVEPWSAGGAAFHVKAHAGAKRDRIAGVHDGMLKVEITAAPEKGKANKAIAKFLAKRLDVPAAALQLLSGETNREKRFGVSGIPPEALREKIRSAMQSVP